MPRISPRKHPSYLFISWSTSPTVGLACIHVTYGPEHPGSMSTTPFVSYPLLWTTRYHRLRSRDQEIIMILVVLFQYFQFSLEKHRFDLKNLYNYIKNFYILLLNYILHVLHELLFFLNSCCFQNHNARIPNEVLHGKLLLQLIEFNIIYFTISSQEKCKIILRIFSLSP